MGLTVIITILLYLMIGSIKSKGLEAIKDLLMCTVIGCLLSAFASNIAISLMSMNVIESKLECVNVEVEQLEEISSGVYAVGGMIGGGGRTPRRATINVKVNGDYEELDLDDCKIYLGNNKKILETYTFGVEDKILKVLFFDVKVCKYEVYIPQKNIGGNYSIIVE